MRISAVGFLFAAASMAVVGCVSERTVNTVPIAGYFRDGSVEGPAPAVPPATPSPSPAVPRGAAEGGDAQQHGALDLHSGGSR
jgi:hypothetical protein